MLRNSFDYRPALTGHDRSGDSHRTAKTTSLVQPHEIPEHTAEAASRALTRIVPLVYGVLLGVTGDIIVVGLLIGGIGSLAFDLSMDDHSLARTFARRIADTTRPAAAAAAAAIGKRRQVGSTRRRWAQLDRTAAERRRRRARRP